MADMVDGGHELWLGKPVVRQILHSSVSRVS